MSAQYLIWLSFFGVIWLSQCVVQAQQLPPQVQPTQLPPSPNDTLPSKADTIALRIAPDAFDEPVRYSATDSIIYDIENSKIYLYGTAKVMQDKINLTAGQIIIDNNTKQVTAFGKKDTAKRVFQRPNFSDGSQQFEADTLAYNFKTKRGRIADLVTQEGEGYLHGSKVKKDENNHLFASDAYYTTCNREHPHFSIRVNKVKVIPQELIVSGPAQLVIEDVPTPLFLPFGIFPLQKGQRNGVIIPRYGYSPSQGFYLRQGGYYVGFGEYLDASVMGDIYSNGTWLFTGNTRYRKRYKYNGNFSASYGIMRVGDPITTDFQRTKSFNVKWEHNQDPSAHPVRNFSASVRYASENFNRDFQTANSDVLANSYNSRISYTTSFPGTPFTLAALADLGQSLSAGNVTITLPQLTLTMARIFPFKRKMVVGKSRWYENIGVTYNLNTEARASVADSLLFTKKLLDTLQTGMKQSIATNVPVKLLKYITLTPSVNYNEYWYLKTVKKVWQPASVKPKVNIDNEAVLNENGDPIFDTIPASVVEQEHWGFKSARDFNAGISATTKLFGTFLFKRGKLRGIRHELTPSVGFNYRPDFSQEMWGVYTNIRDEAGNPITRAQNNDADTLYSVLENGIYGTPSRGKTGAISFSLGNNLQMKVASKNDTTGKGRNINILNSLNINTNYNVAADSMRWSKIAINGATTLFKNRLQLNFNTAFDPYITAANGRNLNQTEWATNGRLARFTNAGMTLRTTFDSKSKNNRVSTSATEAELEELVNYPDDFIDFNIPFSISIDYVLSLNRNRKSGVYANTITQTLNTSGNFNLTPNWKVGFNTGYDFTNKKVARTTFNVIRDLHCWEMAFNFAPFKAYSQFYEFRINVKASVLQDLKLTRQRYLRDF